MSFHSKRHVAKSGAATYYFKSWSSIFLNRNQKWIVYYDPFAGPPINEAEGEEYHSTALQIIDAALKHTTTKQGWKLTMLLGDKDAVTAAQISEAIVNNFPDSVETNVNGWITLSHPKGNIEVIILQLAAADSLAKLIEMAKGARPPIFAFVDPYGWSGIPKQFFDKMRSSFPASDIFVNFMSGFINRFRKEQNRHASTRALVLNDAELETTDYIPFIEPELDDLSPTQRYEALCDQFSTAVKREGDRETRIAVRSARNQHIYHLLLLTRSLKGVELMKVSLWRQATNCSDNVLTYSEAENERKLTPEQRKDATKQAIIAWIRAGNSRTEEDVQRYIDTRTIFYFQKIPYKQAIAQLPSEERQPPRQPKHVAPARDENAVGNVRPLRRVDPSRALKATEG